MHQSFSFSWHAKYGSQARHAHAVGECTLPSSFWVFDDSACFSSLELQKSCDLVYSSKGRRKPLTVSPVRSGLNLDLLLQGLVTSQFSTSGSELNDNNECKCHLTYWTFHLIWNLPSISPLSIYNRHRQKIEGFNSSHL